MTFLEQSLAIFSEPRTSVHGDLSSLAPVLDETEPELVF
jgi:hypothetical protein